jgi:hypothetical protein
VKSNKDDAKADSIWITRFSREWERQFFFYVTVAALAFWGISQAL